MSELKLRAWQRAGLIDAETAQRIRDWEAQNPGPAGIWAIVGLGALAVGLGIASIIAANWDAIPGELRLSVHFALMSGLAGWLCWYLPRTGTNGIFSDGALFILAILGLTFLAHVGQVYQTSSPLWQPLLLWLVVFSPLLLLFGRDWPVATLWMAAVLGTAWAHTDQYGDILMWQRTAPQPSYPALYWGLIGCPPMAIAMFATVLRGTSKRPGFWRLLEQLTIATILAGLSLLIVVRGLESRTHYLFGSVILQSIALLAAAAVTFRARPTRSGRATAMILAAGALLHIGQALLLDFGPPMRGPWISSILFLALWSAVAASALHAEWRGIFQLAIAVIALRIIILSLQLNDNLLNNGVSLILSGAFAMLVAWATVQISKRYAPVRQISHG